MDQSLGSRLVATIGGRFDYFALNGQGVWSPRLGLAYELDPRTTLTAAAGVYHQTLPLWLLVQHPDNHRLDHLRASHYVAGARSRGVEVLVRKKLAQHVYGLASYGYTVSRYTDLEGTERNRTFDHRHVASAVLGYRPSDRFEYSLRWRYAGGRPYTPFDPVLSSHAGAGIIQRDRVNTERQPAYHRLDVRLDHRMQFEHFNLVSFVSVFNVYNRRNLFRYFWSTRRNATRRSNQWGFIPVGGFELEFQ